MCRTISELFGVNAFFCVLEGSAPRVVAPRVFDGVNQGRLTDWLLKLHTVFQNDLEQVLRQIGDKDQKIQNLEALLQKSKDSVGQLEAEREDLCAKIQAGEGEAAVLNQLQEKNHAVQEQVRLSEAGDDHSENPDVCLTPS